MTLLDERPEAIEKCSHCGHDAHKRNDCTAHKSELLKGKCDCWWEEPTGPQLSVGD